MPFVSYMALHNDFTHLAINCLWLLAFGPIVARRFGGFLFLLFFLICGVAGAAAHLAFNWGSLVPVIGASGAISGLMAAGLRLLPTQAPWANAGEEKLAPIFSRQILLFTLVWMGINLVAGLTGLGVGGEAGLIAWQAHLGGYLAGCCWRGRSTGCGRSSQHALKKRGADGRLLMLNSDVDRYSAGCRGMRRRLVLARAEHGELVAQPVEIDVDHRRDVERQQLRQEQAARHAQAQRPAGFRARAQAQRDRQACPSSPPWWSS